MNDTDIRAAFEEKVRRGIYDPIRRHLPVHVAEDRLQEGLGLTWKLFADHAEKGELLDDALLVHACRLRAVAPSRSVVPADGARKKDVYDERNRLSGKVALVPIDDIGYAEPFCANPTAKLDSALDLAAWLASVEPGDRELLELRVEGYGLPEIAEKTGWSTSTIFARLRKLGLELAERTGIDVEPRRHTRVAA